MDFNEHTIDTIYYHIGFLGLCTQSCLPALCIRVLFFRGPGVGGDCAAHCWARALIVPFAVGRAGQRIGAITTLSFHPDKLLLAAGSADSYISVFAGQNE
jgi:hypothetical protein